MAEITLKAIEDLLDLKLDEKFDAKLAPVQKTLNQHTGVLDGIAKNVKTMMDEKTIAADRVGRLEHWAQQVGEQLGIRLEL